MKIIKCIHVTATEKKHLTELFKSGLQDAKINRKFYSIISSREEGNDIIYKIKISTPLKNDYGKIVFDIQTIEVIN